VDAALTHYLAGQSRTARPSPSSQMKYRYHRASYRRAPHGRTPWPPTDPRKEEPDLRGAGPGLKVPGRPGPNPADARPAKPGEKPLDETTRGVDTWDLIRALDPQASTGYTSEKLS